MQREREKTESCHAQAAGWKAEGMGARVLGQLVGKVVAVFAVLSLSLASPQV